MPDMSKPEDMVKFLIACIRHAAAGKINWEGVAQECEIVSKAAAAKRYERLLRAHNLHPSTNAGTASPATNSSGGAEPKSHSKSLAKRKAPDDRDETPTKTKSGKTPKMSTVGEDSTMSKVKKEDGQINRSLFKQEDGQGKGLVI